MTNYNRLMTAGMDIESFLGRLMGNAALIRVFIKKFLEDTNFDKLQGAFSLGDMQSAEMASHTLKGMCGNMSLNILYGLFSEQTNLIRAGDIAAAEQMMPHITETYSHTVEQMRLWIEEN